MLPSAGSRKRKETPSPKTDVKLSRYSGVLEKFLWSLASKKASKRRALEEELEEKDAARRLALEEELERENAARRLALEKDLDAEVDKEVSAKKSGVVIVRGD